MLEIANLEVVYNEVILVLRGLSIQVPDGQIVALLGSNGAGKTTFLKCIATRQISIPDFIDIWGAQRREHSGV